MDPNECLPKINAPKQVVEAGDRSKRMTDKSRSVVPKSAFIDDATVAKIGDKFNKSL